MRHGMKRGALVEDSDIVITLPGEPSQFEIKNPLVNSQEGGRHVRIALKILTSAGGGIQENFFSCFKKGRWDKRGIVGFLVDR